MSRSQGVRKRHSQTCRARSGGRCNCDQGWEAWVWSTRDGKKIRKTFATEAAARRWRADAVSQASRGGLRAPSPTTIREAAAELLSGMRDGLPMARSRAVSHCCAMVYGAVWAEASRPHQLYAGRLSVTSEGVVLDGPSSSRTIPPDEIRAIHRGPGPGRVSGRGWLHLDFSRGSGLILTTVFGAATLSELYDLVNGLL